MDFQLKTTDPQALAALKADALIVPVAEGYRPSTDALGQLITAAMKAGDWDTKPGKLLAGYRQAGVAATRLLLVGAGDGSPRQVRAAVAAAMAHIKGSPARHVALGLGLAGDAAANLPAAMQAVADGSYVYTATRSKAEPRRLDKVSLGVPASDAAVKAAFEHGRALVAGIELAREWGNRPPNHATPSHLAQAARELARNPRMRCEVLGPREVTKLGMGAFLAVARGADEPLRFIVLRYDGSDRTDAPHVLVGKGITFDTGGISLKPAPEMDEMKFDMCGAASVLGVFRALAELKPRLNVVGLIPACENMPDGRATRPGDVVTTLSGQTVEILNTDAEGRLILCDAITYARRFKPRAVIDIATLTGACMIALGAHRSGLFATDDALANALGQAGDVALDPCWRMPLDDEYAEGLKTHFADVANVGGRPAGAVTAAKFLQRFADGMPWAHLDIAGVAWKSGGAKGSTGRPVGLLLRYLMDQAAQTGAATRQARTRTRKAA